MADFDVSFRRIFLTADQVRHNILPGDFDPKNGFYPPRTYRGDGGAEVCREGGGVFTLQGAGGAKTEAYLFVTQGIFRSKDGFINAVGVGVAACGSDLKECSERAKDDATAGAVHQITDHKGLPDDSAVVSANYGDWNNDGKTDLLVTLSKGAAILYEQR
jgi:hypothetical protein